MQASACAFGNMPACPTDENRDGAADASSAVGVDQAQLDAQMASLKSHVVAASQRIALLERRSTSEQWVAFTFGNRGADTGSGTTVIVAADGKKYRVF